MSLHPEPSTRAMARQAIVSEELANAVERAAGIARSLPNVTAFEIRADERDDRRYAMRDGASPTMRAVVSTGLGMLIYAGGASAYVYTVDLSSPALREAAERGRRLAIANGHRAWERFDPVLVQRRARYLPDVKDAPSRIEDPAPVFDLLKRVCEGAHHADPTTGVQAGFGAYTNRMLLVDSAESWVERESLVSTLVASVTQRTEGRVGHGVGREGGEFGLGDYQHPEELGRTGAARARESVDAVPITAGRYRVLCDSELSGTLAHESFGHLAEHDLVSSGWSTLAGRRGETLAAPEVSVADAPLVAGGKQGVVVPFDDQGTPGKPVTMLDKGVLSAWMHTRDSAVASGEEAAGNGRALNARFPPIVRMRNTYFEPGDHTFEEALEQLDDGLYLLGAQGGSPHSDGSFMFTSSRGYRVRRGKIEEPVRTTAIHGKILDFLQNVEALTRDFKVVTNYYGGCGKRDQSYLHVGVGGPHVLVSDALVGGSVQ